ncbi:hypothetical protein TRFO_17455 [Tritrichomonas foetus]|uniref:Uncharacterized protein n=1 Tax=Tritrichomonas foetus TaxID=1144522 RepID=A0A1J4KMU0_9EUKA|nr:hypothetical protein TRFO_17455 [Tritrichomonas foetus]|eukprot:OHT12639.1 hypothetical protein TRFO_17455 [Tritrichomonas foetus]
MFQNQNKNAYICYGKVATANPTLKWDDFWIQVRGFWLEISKKVGQPCYFLIPLDLASLSAGFLETNVQNSISLVTSPKTGSTKIFLQSTNRFDVIQLYHAIQTGQGLLKTALQKSQITKAVEFDCETVSSFFNLGKTKLKLVGSQKGFEFTSNKNSSLYEMDKIHSLFAKVNDNSADTRLCINVEENGSTVTKEFNCMNHQNLLNAISCFLINSYNWEIAARQASMNTPTVSDI